MHREHSSSATSRSFAETCASQTACSSWQLGLAAKNSERSVSAAGLERSSWRRRACRPAGGYEGSFNECWVCVRALDSEGAGTRLLAAAAAAVTSDCCKQPAPPIPACTSVVGVGITNRLERLEYLIQVHFAVLQIEDLLVGHLYLP